AAAAFKLFHAIPRERIDRELDEAPGNYLDAANRICAYHDMSDEQRTPEACAEFLHDQFVHAYAAKKCPLVDDRIAFHLAGYAARTVGHTVVNAAWNKGELGKLNAKMDAVCEASGDEHFADRRPENQPKEYVEMAERAGDLIAGV